MPRLLISSAAVHGAAGAHDVFVADGAVQAIVPSGSRIFDADDRIDAAGGLVSRGFVEPHLHPDKSFSLSELPPARRDDDRVDHFARAARIKAGFTVETVARRARRAFELAVSNGVTRLRANVDVDGIAGLTGLHGVLSARDEVASIVDVDVVAFPQEGLVRDPAAYGLLREALVQGASLVGGWPNVEATFAEQVQHVQTVFDLGEEFDVDVDIHADCWLDQNERMLEVIADETIRRGFAGRVLASHCCGLELYSPGDAERVIARVADADVAIAIIPLNLADGGPRGLSRPHELLRAGVRVVIGSDNLNDGWYPLGTLNPLDRAFMTLVGGGFEEDDDTDTVWDMVTGGAAQVLGGVAGPLAVGVPGDLVVFGAGDRLAALRSPGGAITTIKSGRVVAERTVDERVLGGARP